MAVLNPDHLLDQAERLISPSGRKARQVDLRRAISAAYYAVFHDILTAGADEFVGRTQRQTKIYALVYRRPDHRTLKTLCSEAGRPALKQKYRGYVSGGFGGDIQVFSSAFVQLQEKRHSADYDPYNLVSRSEARFAIATARSAVALFHKADESQRKAFLTLLFFSPR